MRSNRKRLRRVMRLITLIVGPERSVLHLWDGRSLANVDAIHTPSRGFFYETSSRCHTEAL